MRWERRFVEGFAHPDSPTRGDALAAYDAAWKQSSQVSSRRRRLTAPKDKRAQVAQETRRRLRSAITRYEAEAESTALQAIDDDAVKRDLLRTIATGRITRRVRRESEGVVEVMTAEPTFNERLRALDMLSRLHRSEPAAAASFEDISGLEIKALEEAPEAPEAPPDTLADVTGLEG